jgi:hypothetical protein
MSIFPAPAVQPIHICGVFFIPVELVTLVTHKITMEIGVTLQVEIALPILK